MKASLSAGEDQTIRRLISGFVTNLETIITPVLPVISIAFIVAVIVILYLTGASRVAATGYDIRDFEQRRVRLEREEQRLLNRASEPRPSPASSVMRRYALALSLQRPRITSVHVPLQSTSTSAFEMRRRGPISKTCQCWIRCASRFTFPVSQKSHYSSLNQKRRST